MLRNTKTFFLIVFLSAMAFYCYHFVFSVPRVSLSKTTFQHVPAWEHDDQSQALRAFQKSCVEIIKRDPHATFGSFPQSKKNDVWQTICFAANQLHHPDKITARRFFEYWFEPYTVKNHFNSEGLFTGYYLPLLQGHLKKNKKYTVPMYGLPADLVKVNIALFDAELPNKTIVGQLKNNALFPYPDRAAIHRGELGNNAKVLAWSHSAIDVFFAQIQGSAIVQLPRHQQVLMGYASSNGRPYTPIGKILIENKAISKKNMSMQAIRHWLSEHPEQVDDVLNQNASYVFFRLLKTGDPLGTEQVPLTPQRSLAVDTHYIPLGAPVWLKTEVPEHKPEGTWSPYRRLLIAQDTGGAIKGIVRGDIYWGAGEKAAFSAGHMKQPGRYWILLPRRA